jgi:hypothetical protein
MATWRRSIGAQRNLRTCMMRCSATYILTFHLRWMPSLEFTRRLRCRTLLMRADNWYVADSNTFPHNNDLLATDTRSIEKKIAFFDGVCWYAALSFISRCIFVSCTIGCRGCFMSVVLGISDILRYLRCNGYWPPARSRLIMQTN